MKSNFSIGQVVKFTNPNPGEEDLRFYVTEIHESNGELKEKLHLELISNDVIKPTFCHFSDEYEPSYFTEKVEYDGMIVECENFGRIC